MNIWDLAAGAKRVSSRSELDSSNDDDHQPVMYDGCPEEKPAAIARALDIMAGPTVIPL